MELEGRKRAIFFSIVEHYLKTGEPAGSKLLCFRLGNTVSPATIRNEMARLVEQGFISQPHTSAGRVPTLFGLRYYAKHLPFRRLPSERVRREIENLVTARSRDPETLIVKVGSLAAEKTGCAFVSAETEGTGGRISAVEFISAGKEALVLVIIISGRQALSRLCGLESPVSAEMLEGFRRALSDNVCGRSPCEITLSFVQTLAATLPFFSLQLSTVLFALYEMCSGSETRVFVEGEANLLSFSELEPRSASLLRFLQERGKLSELISKHQSSSSDSVQFVENVAEGLPNLSFILSKYRIRDRGGFMGLIGPVRLDYSALIPFVEYIASVLSSVSEDDKS